ncbi:hypothetical protein GC194_13415 [bacterium]|nr:hypothetical protein [bacterium]
MAQGSLYPSKTYNSFVKKAIFLFTLSSILVLLGNSAFAQSKVVLSGYVYEKTSEGDSILPVSNINVINLRNFTGTVSLNNGYFTLEIKKGDTVVFSSIAHTTDTFICSTDEPRSKLFLTVILKPEFHPLNSIDVYGKDFEGFKHDFVHLEVKDTVFIRLAPQWKFEPMKQGFGVTINGPLTALWNAFSKQGKELRKLAMLIEAEEEQNYMDSVYKRPVVLSFLELDESEIEDLVNFCNFSKQYVGRVTDYELLLALEHCYQEYKKFHH